MTVCTIVGARPQFIKAAAVSRTLVEAGVSEVLIHTGQHYDEEMSRVFFADLGIPKPTENLDVGSGSHAKQTGEMMVRLEDFLNERDGIDCLMVYGDTNSTLAGALTAAKMHIPIAHVEAGLRSFNRAMPEEINRIATDRLSELLFCPTRTSIDNLSKEGISSGVVLTGDVMLEATRLFGEKADEVAPLNSIIDRESEGYFLATIHRAENTDDPKRLGGILEGLSRADRPVVVPLHPRTRGKLQSLEVPGNVELMKPVGYLQMLTLVKNAAAVLTDSGGVQKEAYWLGRPCVTLRDETEWVETLEGGWNQLAGADPDEIAACLLRTPESDQGRFGAGPGGTEPSRIIASSLRERIV